MRSWMLALSVAFFLAATASADWITISNADFNIQPPGGWAGGNAAPEWDNRSANNNEASSTFNHSGSGGSLKIWAGANIYVAHQDATIQDGGVIPAGTVAWSASYYAYTPSADYYTNGSINFHIEWFTNFSAGGEVAARSYVDLPQNITPNSWLQVSGGGAVPGNATRWRFVFEQSGFQGGAIYLDDVAVQAVIPEPPAVALLGLGALAGLARLVRMRLRRRT